MTSIISDKNIEKQFDNIFTKHAIAALEINGKESIRELIGFLSDPREDVAMVAVAILKKVVPLAAMPERWIDDRPFVAEDAVGLPEWIVDSGRDWGTENDFSSLCIKEFLGLQGDRENCDRFFNRLIYFPGIERRFAELLVAEGKENAAQKYNDLLQYRKNILFPFQIGLSPTMNCQLHCDYCVSAGHQQIKEASLPSMLKTLEWCKINDIVRIGFCGGEPTLYSQFLPLVEYMTNDGFEWYMATNGLIATNVLEMICRKKPKSVTMHLTPEVFEGKLLNTFVATANRMVDAELYVVLRINIVRPDMDLAGYLDVATRTGIEEVRCAVPMPNANRHNTYIKPGKLAAYGDALGRYVDEGQKRELKTILAKPFPICQMSEKAAKIFLANGSMAKNCPVHIGNFANNIVVMPDNTFIPCLGLNQPSPKPILQYKSLKEAGNMYSRAIQRLSAIPLVQSCPLCPFWRGGRCLGGCLSYRLSDVDVIMNN